MHSDMYECEYHLTKASVTKTLLHPQVTLLSLDAVLSGYVGVPDFWNRFWGRYIAVHLFL